MSRRSKNQKPLTEKQELVRSRLVAGKPIAEIAEEMGVGEGTVYNHRRKVIDAGHSIAPDFKALVPPVAPKIPPQSELPHLTDGNGHGHGMETAYAAVTTGLAEEKQYEAELAAKHAALVGEVEAVSNELRTRQERIAALEATVKGFDTTLMDKSMELVA